MGSGLEVLSVEDGKIPTKKVKVQDKISHFLFQLCLRTEGLLNWTSNVQDQNTSAP